MANRAGFFARHLIPTPIGGKRPIGVLPTLVRLWKRTSKPLVQHWARESRRVYDWATQGRSAELAAWHQSLIDEAACADGMRIASVFFDLTKAFETIRLDLVWDAGRQYGFPLTLLRLSLEAFAFERRLRYQNAISAPTATPLCGASRRRLCADRHASCPLATAGHPVGRLPEPRTQSMCLRRRDCDPRNWY